MADATESLVPIHRPPGKPGGFPVQSFYDEYSPGKEASKEEIFDDEREGDDEEATGPASEDGDESDDIEYVDESYYTEVEEDEDFTIFDDVEYLSVPRIPEEYRASDIIGKRTQASSKGTGVKLGPIKSKSKLRAIWDELTDVEKYILMLISEHRHMTRAQLATLIIYPSRIRMQKGGNGVKCTNTYFYWVTQSKYGVSLNVKNTFKTSTDNGLENKLKELCKRGLLAQIHPAYSVDEHKISKRYQETPSLFTDHYYLAPMGAKVLVCNTDVNMPGAPVKPVGFVPTYKSAAYQTILHEAESTEVLCSLISCAIYASNYSNLNPDSERKYGLFDVCRFYHEKDVEEKKVEYNGSKIVFKTDGKLTLYVEQLGDFLDFYIEYDSGSSTDSKIKHKTEAFIKYIFWKRSQYGDRFRKPILLLVTQKPADLFPGLAGRKFTKYTTGIKNMAKNCFPDYLGILNDIAVILVADCGSIRQHGAMGACWHKLDLTTGQAEMKAYDLISASSRVSRGLADE